MMVELGAVVAVVVDGKCSLPWARRLLGMRTTPADYCDQGATPVASIYVTYMFSACRRSAYEGTR